jgi:hypothetical protein
MKMTRRMIGIVQRTRRTTNFNISVPYFRFASGRESGGRLTPPPG